MSQSTPFDAHADSVGRTHLDTIRSLLPFLWPRGYWNLKARVALAVLFLVAAKATNVYVPFLYKGAVDTLDAEAALIAVPVAFIVAYGVARLFAQAFGELRDAAFARVGQHAIRTVALATFNHLHELSLRFHLDRQTGGLSRVIERGTKAIEFILNFTLFNILRRCSRSSWSAPFCWCATTSGSPRSPSSRSPASSPGRSASPSGASSIGAR